MRGQRADQRQDRKQTHLSSMLFCAANKAELVEKQSSRDANKLARRPMQWDSTMGPHSRAVSFLRLEMKKMLLDEAGQFQV